MACILRTLPHKASGCPGSNREPFYLHRNDVWVGQRLNADKTFILRFQYAIFEIGEIVKLPQFLCLVRIVQVSDEPVGSISENISLNRAYFLRGVDHANVVFGSFFGRPNPNIFEISLVASGSRLCASST